MPTLILSVAGPFAVSARPLDKETCEKLAGQRVELAQQGIEKAIVKGPEWTKSNMPKGTLERVRRYLEVEERLRFRCDGVRLPELAPEELAQDAAPDSDTKKKAAVKPAPTGEPAPETRDEATTAAEIPLPLRRPPRKATRFSPPTRRAPKKKTPKETGPSLHQQFFRPGDRP